MTPSHKKTFQADKIDLPCGWNYALNYRSLFAAFCFIFFGISLTELENGWEILVKPEAAVGVRSNYTVIGREASACHCKTGW